MFRGMDSHRTTQRCAVLTVCLSAILLTSCVFNPEKIPPLPPPPPPENEEQLITLLQTSYQHRDFETFRKILSDASGVEYVFLLDKPDEHGETQWGLTEELRIHKRMFQPEKPDPGDLPVPADLWLASVTINLTPEGTFQPIVDNLGLDTAKWKATEAIYDTSVLFDLAGPIDYSVNGRADFIVIEDLTKAKGEEKKFMLYRWQDLERATPKPAT